MKNKKDEKIEMRKEGLERKNEKKVLERKNEKGRMRKKQRERKEKEIMKK